MPAEYLQKCPADLPDAADALPDTIQKNHKDQQQQYHSCASKDGHLIDSLSDQVELTPTPTKK